MLSCGFLQAVLSESELVQAAADNATMGRAQQLLQEEKDEVKHMNRIMRYAKCAASREKQIVVGDTGRVTKGVSTAALQFAVSCMVR
jgi:hypothetical protein